MLERRVLVVDPHQKACVALSPLVLSPREKLAGSWAPGILNKEKEL